MLDLQDLLSDYAIYDLIPDDSHKSFYGKAKVIVTESGTYLKSYNTIIMFIGKDGKIKRFYNDWTATTGRHIKAFSGLSKKEYFEVEFENTPQEQARSYRGALGWNKAEILNRMN